MNRSTQLLGLGFVALSLAVSACTGRGGRSDPCEGIDSEFIPGFDATGFSLGTNGRGYLATIVRFGDCSGRTEGRIFAVDVAARSAEAIPLEFLPGRVAVRPDGAAGLAMAHRDYLGLIGNAPDGVMWLADSSASMIPLGGAVWDVQETTSGWLASAGGGGSWRIGFDGETTQLSTGSSYCGDDLGGGLVLCSSGGVAIADANGALLGSVSLPAPAQYVVATSSLGLVLHGEFAAILEGMTLTTSLEIGAGAWRAWIAPDSKHAFVNGPLSFLWLHLDDLVVEPLQGPSSTDVAFTGTSALVAFDEVVMAEFDLSAETVEIINGSVGHIQQIEPIGPRRFVIVAGKVGDNVEPGYEFEEVFTIYDLDEGWGDTWSLVVE